MTKGLVMATEDKENVAEPRAQPSLLEMVRQHETDHDIALGLNQSINKVTSSAASSSSSSSSSSAVNHEEDQVFTQNGQPLKQYQLERIAHLLSKAFVEDDPRARDERIDNMLQETASGFGPDGKQTMAATTVRAAPCPTCTRAAPTPPD